PNSRTTEVEIINPSGQVERITSRTSLTVETLTQPGWYRIIEQGNTGPLFDNRIAVNTGTALESDLQTQPAPTFSHAVTQSDDIVERRMADLWPWLVLAALIVLAFEWGYVLR
ncbi:MAG: VWA domain-containing protein, partial [Chloroflexota bacterium]